MKQVLCTGISLGLFTITTFSQVNSSHKFPVTGGNVIAYKQGTSCTASPYVFYMINDVGVQASAPFYTLSNTSREVNGIGINPTDRYLYGVEYDRDAACAFSNFHLKRYDAQGGSEDLGTLPPPVAGGSVTAALGCVTNNGNFVYSTKDAAGNSYISIIADIGSLSANLNATLTINSSKQISNTASNFSYADWAVHPTNAKMYSYGIANIGGVSVGKLLQLDPETGVLSSVGLIDLNSFLDPARDNFGGVYFGNDGMLYGVNVNTRKLYKVDPLTGSTIYKSTMAGSGQIRADMGSYSTGWIMLPLNFEKIAIEQKSNLDFLTWQMITNHNVKEFVLEQSRDGKEYTQLQHITITPEERSTTIFSTRLPGSSAYYRIKAISTSGESAYSTVVNYTAPIATGFTVLGNPVRGGQLQLLSASAVPQAYTITTTNGQLVKKGNLSVAKGGIVAINIADLRSGLYLMQTTEGALVQFIKD